MTLSHRLSAVANAPVASCAEALAHFGARLRFETDADDVATALAQGASDFVLVDPRSAQAFAVAHLPGAFNPARPYTAETLADLPPGLVVTYCWGPGCNGAVKAAKAIAELGRPVKEMLGGFEYWVREGHPVEGAGSDNLAEAVDSQGLVKIPGAISCLC